MICPNCKKENINEYATVCAYCKHELYQGSNLEEKTKELATKQKSDKTNSTIKVLISVVLAIAVAVVVLVVPKPDKVEETTTTTHTYSNNENTNANSQGVIDNSSETTTTQNINTTTNQDIGSVYIDSGASSNAGAPQEVVKPSTTMNPIPEPEVEYSNSYYYIFHENDFNFLVVADVVDASFTQEHEDGGRISLKMKIKEIRFLDKTTGKESKVDKFYHSQLPKNGTQAFALDVRQYDINGDLLEEGNLWSDVYGKSVGDSFNLAIGSGMYYSRETAKIKIESYSFNTMEEWEKDVAEYEWLRWKNYGTS